jgi:DNA topoisomerase-3
MRLFIAEKPDVANAICTALGGGFVKQDGCYTHPVKNDVVTYCFGHMLSLKDPEDIDEKYKYWDMQVLPIEPYLPAPRKIPSDKKPQVAIIRDLLKKADTVVHAGDPDDEGQLLVDGLLRYFDNKKPVMRLLINDNTPAVVQKALANLRPNSQFEHLGWIAESRTIADQLFGYNLTRAYSLKQQAKTGEKQTYHIGRVQTPILGLVVRRDRENASHKKSFYYTITGDFVVNGVNFTAKYQPKTEDPTDDKGRLIDKSFSQNLANLLSGKIAKILLANTQHKQQPAPLPYNLLKLQQDASRKFGYKPDDVMNITQSLREKHHLITYNRSDCQYLSDEQFADVSGILSAIAGTFNLMAGACNNANPNQKGRAFNSSKVTAHHGIIPTQTTANWHDLSEKEKNIYKIIARNYVAQFYPMYEYDETKITLDVIVDGVAYQFHATARVDTALGWKKLYTNDTDNEETALPNDVLQADLRTLKASNTGQCTKAYANEHETKPPALYTMTSLLGDLTKVAKYVKDPHLAKILKDKDKDKQGEHGGIGTPATRSAIIENLFTRGYLTEKGKSIISTDKGKALYDLLDDKIRFPDMTAVWHDEQQHIKNEQDVFAFIRQMQDSTIKPTVNTLKADYVKPKPKDKPSYTCPKCQRPMYQKNGKYGLFWGCSGWNDNENPCNHMMNDKDGVPVEKEPKAAQNLTDFVCKKCGSKLTQFDGVSKKTGKPYTKFSCSNFPKCKESYWGKDGKPDFG